MAVEILKSSNLIGGSINPCLYVKKSMKGIIYVALYLDNNLMVGNIATINDAIEVLKNKRLVLKLWKGCRIVHFSMIRSVPGKDIPI